MSPLRTIAIVLILIGSSIAWMVLGGVTDSRTHNQRLDLRHSVAGLWGEPQTQIAPMLTFRWTTTRSEVREETVDNKTRNVRTFIEDVHEQAVRPRATEIDVALRLDTRRKGLMWYPLYDVNFSGHWTYIHQSKTSGTLDILFVFPLESGIYDDFFFVVNDRPQEVTPTAGQLKTSIAVNPGDEVELRIGYASRGMSEWAYRPSHGVARLENFRLRMTTDFQKIDFPAQSMSPSTKTLTDSGWELAWNFKQVVTGHLMGMVMPEKIQPGELAAELSFSAPISLLFFFLVVWSLAAVRKLDLHPINFLFVAAAFFAFHLLFAYSVDRLTVVSAFALSSVVSIVLVASYLRLVVSSRFAFVEATIAQLIYLVGFSLAHFWEGSTGLTVTILSIITLFFLMQLTGRIVPRNASRTPETLPPHPEQR